MIRVYWHDAQGRQMTEHPEGYSAEEMDTGSLTIQTEPDDQGRFRALAIYAPDCWTAAELADDTAEETALP